MESLSRGEVNNYMLEVDHDYINSNSRQRRNWHHHPWYNYYLSRVFTGALFDTLMPAVRRNDIVFHRYRDFLD